MMTNTLLRLLKIGDGVEGIIIGYHTGHGLCYDVRHNDGSIGTYDPDELEGI